MRIRTARDGRAQRRPIDTSKPSEEHDRSGGRRERRVEAASDSDQMRRRSGRLLMRANALQARWRRRLSPSLIILRRRSTWRASSRISCNGSVGNNEVAFVGKLR